MNKKNAEALAVLRRQLQNINKVMVETMNKIEVIRDNDGDAGPDDPQQAGKHAVDNANLSRVCDLLHESSDALDEAEKSLALL